MTETTFDSSIVSDLHKDAYGFRPSSTWMRAWHEMDDAGKQEEWERLCDMMESEATAEREREEIAHKRWSQHITDMMSVNGISKSTAIRWDMQAMDAEGEVGYYCFKWGLAYSNEEKIKQDLNQLPEGKTLGELLNIGS